MGCQPCNGHTYRANLNFNTNMDERQSTRKTAILVGSRFGYKRLRGVTSTIMAGLDPSQMGLS